MTRGEGDPHADVDANPQSADRQRLRADVAQPLCRGCGRLVTGGPEDDELVAADPGDHVRRADGVADPQGHGPQHLIACRVTQGVVDLFEAVDIHQQQHPWWNVAVA